VRSVFKDKLNNLRAQFSLAVHDQNWAEATRLGETIIRDFPNTQMAKEVREKMDALRQRAAQPEPLRT
jgi:outer membrane protein assembly factor BamD (BamD/ComL family)